MLAGVKRPDRDIIAKSPAGLTRCPTCRRHVIAGDTPADRSCPFCAAASGPRFGLRGGLVAASLFGLSACGDGEAERLEAIAEVEAAAEAVAEAAEAERVEAERQAAEAQAAAMAAQALAEEAAAEAAAEARLAEAAEAEAAEAEAATETPTRMRGTAMYTEMSGGDDDPLIYGLPGL